MCVYVCICAYVLVSNKDTSSVVTSVYLLLRSTVKVLTNEEVVIIKVLFTARQQQQIQQQQIQQQKIQQQILQQRTHAKVHCAKRSEKMTIYKVSLKRDRVFRASPRVRKTCRSPSQTKCDIVIPGYITHKDLIVNAQCAKKLSKLPSVFSSEVKYDLTCVLEQFRYYNVTIGIWKVVAVYIITHVHSDEDRKSVV